MINIKIVLEYFFKKIKNYQEIDYSYPIRLQKENIFSQVQNRQKFP